MESIDSRASVNVLSILPNATSFRRDDIAFIGLASFSRRHLRVKQGIQSILVLEDVYRLWWVRSPTPITCAERSSEPFCLSRFLAYRRRTHLSCRARKGAVLTRLPGGRWDSLQRLQPAAEVIWRILIAARPGARYTIVPQSTVRTEHPSPVTDRITRYCTAKFFRLQ